MAGMSRKPTFYLRPGELQLTTTSDRSVLAGFDVINTDIAIPVFHLMSSFTPASIVKGYEHVSQPEGAHDHGHAQ